MFKSTLIIVLVACMVGLSSQVVLKLQGLQDPLSIERNNLNSIGTDLITARNGQEEFRRKDCHGDINCMLFEVRESLNRLDSTGLRLTIKKPIKLLRRLQLLLSEMLFALFETNFPDMSPGERAAILSISNVEGNMAV